MADFNAAAAAATARIFSPNSSGEEKSPAEVLAQSLTLDAPKIDTAVRAFLSLVAARSITATKTEVSKPTNIAGDNGDGRAIKCVFPKEGGRDPNMESLRCARALLKAINGLTLPDEDDGIRDAGEEKGGERRDDDAAWVERKVVRMVWNALVSKGHKVTKMFGRTALRHAYPVILEKVRRDREKAKQQEQEKHDSDSILPVGVDSDLSTAFFEEFGALLYPRNEVGRASDGGTAGDDLDDDDSALLWDADGGAAELKRRRDRRVQRGREASAAAESRAREALSAAVNPGLGESGVAIEEVVEEEETEQESSR